MELQDRVVVVTGGASGIGRSLALAFAAAGAEGVVIADLDGDGASSVAAEVGAAGASAIGVGCDVGVESDVQAVVAAAEDRFGPVDVFCANAGILVTGGIDASDAAWERAWSVNVKSHLFAARAVVPGMVERGSGYLVHTASAAGLLTQLGAAPYSVTKHAVVAFAEWLSITYGDAGVRVSALCPQAVATNLVTTSSHVLAGKPVAVPPPRTDSVTGAAGVGSKGGAGADGVLSPDDVAAKVLEAIGEERFLILPHPEVETYEQRRAGDRERWLRGMRRAQAQMSGG
ncbi:MAG TPA: SDR family NAD(P)-dependent oxidoreductase [Acidimicrobiales bacterium]|nr:SDR family NAD(P)-dependent oxidoreductase [Acidimicrobiales bacterium]